MKEVEIESKLELTEDDFYTLKNIGDLVKFEDQLNIYYDQKYSLVNKAITFRVRLFHDQKPKMTLKIPIKNNLGKREAVELEYDLSFDIKLSNIKEFNINDSLPKELKKELERLQINCLSRIGYMRTYRRKMKLPNGSKIELDEVVLPNGENFFEVEIEDEDHSKHREAINYITQITKCPIPSEISKFERFAKALEGRERVSINHQLSNK